LGQQQANRTGGFQYKRGKTNDPKNPKPEK
jgi:hypothetical protein